MKKKVLLFAVCGVISVMMMTGCSTKSRSAESQAASEAQPTEAGEEKTSSDMITLTIAARGGSHVDVINAVKDKFEKEHNVKIEVLGLEAPDLKQKVALDATNPKGSYDLVMIDDPVMPEFTENGVLLDLTKEGYQDDSDFVKASLALGKNPYGTGDTYALPFAGNVQLLFYNKDIVDQNGGKVPDNWEDVLTVCKKAKESGKNGYIIRGQQGNPIVSDYLPILWAFGGDVFDSSWNVTVDSEEAKAAMQMYLDLLATGANYEKNDLVSSISDGSSSMGLGWPSWFLSNGNAKAAYSVIPGKASSDAKKYPAGEIGNWMMGVPLNCQNKELAIELLKYLTSEEIQKDAVDIGAVPTRTSVFKDKEIASKYPYFEALNAGTESSVVRPRTSKWSSVEDAYGTELSNIVSGIKTIDQGLADAKTAIEAVMNQ